MSKELWLGLIAIILGLIVENTGVEFPLTPEQIYATGIAIIVIVRGLFTQEKLTEYYKRLKHDKSNLSTMWNSK